MEPAPPLPPALPHGAQAGWSIKQCLPGSTGELGAGGGGSIEKGSEGRVGDSATVTSWGKPMVSRGERLRDTGPSSSHLADGGSLQPPVWTGGLHELTLALRKVGFTFPEVDAQERLHRKIRVLSGGPSLLQDTCSAHSRAARPGRRPRATSFTTCLHQGIKSDHTQALGPGGKDILASSSRMCQLGKPPLRGVPWVTPCPSRKTEQEGGQEVHDFHVELCR